MSTERRRSSLGLAKNKIKVMQPMLATFTSKEFLTAHSLFNNLYSSEDLKIDLSTNDFMKTVFGNPTLTQARNTSWERNSTSSATSTNAKRN
jgi:hypothetical protein